MGDLRGGVLSILGHHGLLLVAWKHLAMTILTILLVLFLTLAGIWYLSEIHG